MNFIKIIYFIEYILKILSRIIKDSSDYWLILTPLTLTDLSCRFTVSRGKKTEYETIKQIWQFNLIWSPLLEVHLSIAVSRVHGVAGQPSVQIRNFYSFKFYEDSESVDMEAASSVKVRRHQQDNEISSNLFL